MAMVFFPSRRSTTLLKKICLPVLANTSLLLITILPMFRLSKAWPSTQYFSEKTGGISAEAFSVTSGGFLSNPMILSAFRAIRNGSNGLFNATRLLLHVDLGRGLVLERVHSLDLEHGMRALFEPEIQRMGLFAAHVYRLAVYLELADPGRVAHFSDDPEIVLASLLLWLDVEDLDRRPVAVHNNGHGLLGSLPEKVLCRDHDLVPAVLDRDFLHELPVLARPVEPIGVVVDRDAAQIWPAPAALPLITTEEVFTTEPVAGETTVISGAAMVAVAFCC